MIEAVARAAMRWRIPEHELRQKAVRATLQAPNRFTPEALDFAINQQMGLLEGSRLRTWIGGRQVQSPCVVGVLCAGNVPFAGLQDLLAVTGGGHRYLGAVSRKSPVLLPAFAAEAGLDARFVAPEEVWQGAEAIIVTGTDATCAWAQTCAIQRGLSPNRCLLRGHRYSVAILDGQENDREKAQLAEDVLLHEGLGCRNVAIIWAPAGCQPDPYVEYFKYFRETFPTHPDTSAVLEVQQSLLEALAWPYVSGEAKGYLLSRGPPEPQGPGHVRWVSYTDLGTVEAWLTAHKNELQCVFARESLTTAVSTETLGSAQRPALDWRPDGQDITAFLTSL